MKVANPNHFLLTEKYRPSTINDTILPERLKKSFRAYIDDKFVPNLLLSGPHGIGKTTIAKAVLNELRNDHITINGSLKGNIDTLRTSILNYASTKSFKGGRKYIILDEADHINPNSTQPALRNFMEEFSDNCGFIFTCNYENKIIGPLHSRLSKVDFSIRKEEKLALASEFCKRVFFILDNEGLSYDKNVIVQLVKNNFPDFRKCLTDLQRYKVDNTIDSSIINSFQEISIKNLIESMKKKDFTAIRTWVAENNDIETAIFYRTFYDTASMYFTPVGIAQLVLILSKYQYQESFVANRDINLAAMCVELMLDAEFK